MINFTLNDIGLLLNAFGVLLVFLYGIAPQLSRSGTIHLSVGESNTEKTKAKKYDFWARTGLAFIFIGFVLQLANNHIDISLNLSITVTTLFFLVVGIALALIYGVLRFINNKILLTGQYFPQYNVDKPSNSYGHLWQFTIINNTGKRIERLELCLPSKVDRIDVMRLGEELTSYSKTNSVEVKKLGPNSEAKLRIWNMGSGPGTGEDVYVVLKGKIIRARILPSLES